MKREIGVQPALYPMPVLMIATYNEDDTVDVMNMAWGGICARDMVALNISRGHKTTKNLEARGAFTLSVADVAHLDESDYFGIASGNKVADKFERTGMTATKSSRVDAPVVDQYPITLECSVVEMQEQPYGLRVLGKIENVLADEAVLNEDGKVDPVKLNAFAFDQFQSGYYALGEKVGQAWSSGKRFM
ncbi:flavin reductase family protein [Enorma burkinafasonensis]|uniref:flavin reductase family protein n=1 Tax=Enorma burkinafasonensis TaxID=2590867 RepID=UPI0011A044FD|nr:flavin reductase family protein [Enorma burkinafasonensis]